MTRLQDLQTRLTGLMADADALARHESAALLRHRAALEARWRVARRTRTVGELMRHQIDLLPLTRRHVVEDHRQRVRLLRSLLRRLARDAGPPSNG